MFARKKQCCDPRAATCHSSRDILDKRFLTEKRYVFFEFFYYNSKSYQDINLKLGMYNQGYNISDTCRQFFDNYKNKKVVYVERQIVDFSKF